MTTFNYKAKDKAGNTVTGTIQAENEKAAAGKIREFGHYPMDIKPTSTPAPADSMGPGKLIEHYFIAPFWTGVNIRALAMFYRQLAVLLSSGMSLGEALTTLGNRTRGRLGRIIMEAAKNIYSGSSLSDTFGKYPRIFGAMQISLIRAGESGGLVQPMIERIASYLEYELSIRRRLVMIMFYPVLIFIAIICVPHLPALIMDGLNAFLLGLWSSVKIWMPRAAVICIILKFIFQFDGVKFIWDCVKITPPVLGTMARKIAMTRFSRALALLYSAGLPMSESVTLAADASSNVYLRNQIKKVVPKIREGWGLTEALVKSNVVIPMVLDMLLTGEKTGSLDEVLQKVSDYMDEEVDATIHKTGITLFVVSILVAGFIVLKMAFSFYVGGLGETMRLPR